MKWLVRWFDKHVVELFPGLALLIAIIEYFVEELRAPSSHQVPEAWLYMLVSGVAIYLLGSSWDAILFDPLFSVPDLNASRFKRLWWGALAPLRWVTNFLPPGKRLRQARVTAGQALNRSRADRSDFSGLHETAARLVSFTKQWEEEIERWLERSKAARSLLFPLLLLTLFRYRFAGYAWPFRDSFLSQLWLWQWDAALFVVALLAFIWLRLVHMRRLYELTTSSFVQAVVDGHSFRATYLIPEAELPYLLQASSELPA
jgi:hypothetical protein